MFFKKMYFTSFNSYSRIVLVLTVSSHTEPFVTNVLQPKAKN